VVVPEGQHAGDPGKNENAKTKAHKVPVACRQHGARGYNGVIGMSPACNAVPGVGSNPTALPTVLQTSLSLGFVRGYYRKETGFDAKTAISG